MTAQRTFALVYEFMASKDPPWFLSSFQYRISNIEGFSLALGFGALRSLQGTTVVGR
jgi:hypothetical protein